MLPPLNELVKRLGDLRSYLSHLERLEAIQDQGVELARAAASAPTTVPPQRISPPDLRAFNYTSCIIILFGAYERFIEELALEYLRTATKYSATFKDMPERIRESHSALSLDLMQKLPQSRFRSRVDLFQMVAKLYKCLAEGDAFEINEEAFIQHSANFRSTMLPAYFGRLIDQLPFERVRGDSRIEDFLQGHSLPYEPLYILDDLCDRRNEVAHGPVEQILSVEYLRIYIEYVETFCLALHDEINNEVLKLVVGMAGKRLGTPVHVFNHQIVCFQNLEVSIKVGDIIVAKTPENRFRSSNIESLQINHEDISFVESIGMDGVGVKVTFYANQNQEYYLVESAHREAHGPSATISEAPIEGDFGEDEQPDIDQ